MASPASSPAPISSRRSAASTSKPRPPAPIIEAMITMLSESMMTWLTPTIRLSRADGTITFHVICRRLHPTMLPRSRMSDGTERMARMVMRAIGGRA